MPAALKLISANGLRQVIADTQPAFEAASGRRLDVTVVETGEIRRRVLQGEAFDVIVVPDDAMAAFVAQRRVVADSLTPTVLIRFGLAVRADRPAPDVSTPEALKRALLAAKSLAITDPSTGGISGVHAMAVLEQLGIAAAVAPRLMRHPGRQLHAARVVAGEADLAVQAEHEILSVPGARFLDYPEPFRRAVSFVAAVGASAADAGAARDYLAFLKGPEAKAAMIAHHLSPA